MNVVVLKLGLGCAAAKFDRTGAVAGSLALECFRVFAVLLRTHSSHHVW